ncbi:MULTISPECIES: hypothetical protein [unclassified Streptomyces]|uniref:hypothetical protein n=1 Tax=unclassified Streptomyces TaxID=2593676 RepID=UPI002E2C7A17|nr:hypothetical protein [Streptomyces sp. NBC_00228]
MTTHAWFEVDDPDDEFEFTDDERAFASVLSAHCMAWAPADVFGEVGRPDDWESLLAYVSLSDRAEPRGRHLIDLGVHLVDGRVRGDRLHNQLYLLPDQPHSWALDTTGPTDELARVAADWFRAVLDKPIVLYVWIHEGYAYAARYAYADSGETLSQSYVKKLAPDGQAAELTEAGHVHGRGWIQTVGLPTPSLYLHIRGDLDKGSGIPGVRATTKRGSLPGLWYG